MESGSTTGCRRLDDETLGDDTVQNHKTPMSSTRVNGSRFRTPARKAGAAARTSTRPLSVEASQQSAARLTAELEPLATEEALEEWAFQSWPKVNTLRLEDVERLREAFDARLSAVRMSGQTSKSPQAEHQVGSGESAEARAARNPESATAAGWMAPDDFTEPLGRATARRGLARE
jgi:hypothetical protein